MKNLKNEFTLKVTKTTKVKSLISAFIIKITHNRIKSSPTKCAYLFSALTVSLWKDKVVHINTQFNQVLVILPIMHVISKSLSFENLWNSKVIFSH